MTTKPKKRTKKGDNSQQASKYELIPYIDYLTDTRKIAAAQVLAYSGYERGNHCQGAVSAAARAAGVNRTTIYDWLDCDKFVTAIKEAKYELCALAVKELEKMARKGNPAVAMFIAERTAPHLWSSAWRKQQHEKEMLQLKAQLGISDESSAPPAINIVIAEDSKDYERNKV